MKISLESMVSTFRRVNSLPWNSSIQLISLKLLYFTEIIAKDRESIEHLLLINITTDSKG